jgi:lipopolysaccharide transport system ATP-binding protein
MSLAISVEQLSKKYILKHERTPQYSTLRDAIPAALRNTGRRILGKSPEGASIEEFWALSNICFEVNEGDRIGIVGRNGAGKSTLLKLLSRIVEPTAGKIQIRGRLASLLEVGTGFNPELSGRENIYLNGAILGMSREQIKRKFDEIVDFSEVEKFLDTPVKRYSSGMYMRLAFGVAAHLEPEILVVDEVLAVGDAQFQKKCLGKMDQLSQSGRTILFVTHNMDAMIALCNRGIVLNGGKLVFDGSSADARNEYLNNIESTDFSVANNAGRGGSGGAKIGDVWIGKRSEDDNIGIISGAELSIGLEAIVAPQFWRRTDIQIAFGIDSIDGTRLFTYISSWDGFETNISDGQIRIQCFVDELPLISGRYLISATILFQGETLDSIQHCASFSVRPRVRSVHIERYSGWGMVDLPCRMINI